MQMKIPQKPPAWPDILRRLDPDRLVELVSSARSRLGDSEYLHWDVLRRHTPPNGLAREEWWLATKLARLDTLKSIGLTDRHGHPFQFSVPDVVSAELHKIDRGAGSMVNVPEPIMNPQTRDRYLISSLMEEAITSSQLEGAITTRAVAREMIRTGRAPRDVSEQMILNNYRTMRRVRDVQGEPLTPSLVFDLHRRITESTLDDEAGAGRFRTPDEKRVVGDDEGVVYHEPPSASELPIRMEAMCAFANGDAPGYFVHPAVRAIILHFWLAYDHPFVDGNGRTARALFYWAMLRADYWIFEFISISTILRRAPIQYGRSFLYTETDDNDLTYFLIAQTKVIREAVHELHKYIARKTAELREASLQIRALDLFNHRQVALIRHALTHPGHRYTVASHKASHGVAYQTARTDLLDLEQRGVLELRKRGKPMVFTIPKDLSARLTKLES